MIYMRELFWACCTPMQMSPCWRRMLRASCLALLVSAVVCRGSEAGPTDDQLEYGTRSRDRRFLAGGPKPIFYSVEN